MRAEGMIGQNEALELYFVWLGAEYVDCNCPNPQMRVRYFAFPTLFDRLAYRRVNDPRKHEDVHEPFDRLYGDLTACTLRYENADEGTIEIII